MHSSTRVGSSQSALPLVYSDVSSLVFVRYKELIKWRCLFSINKNNNVVDEKKTSVFVFRKNMIHDWKVSPISKSYVHRHWTLWKDSSNRMMIIRIGQIPSWNLATRTTIVRGKSEILVTLITTQPSPFSLLIFEKEKHIVCCIIFQKAKDLASYCA